MEKNGILFNRQFGFRSKHSTTQPILSIVDKIQLAIEEGAYSCGIFLDLSNAFDTVNHELLIKKLKHYGFQGTVLNWFRSYLTNRKQLVSFGNSDSNVQPISCGVPQGSVLGPLLFLIYINDFHNASNALDFHLFADDSNLFYKNKNLASLEMIINDQLNSVHTWLCANKLSLNIDKSNFVIFHPPQKKLPHQPQIFINNTPLKKVDSLKYLGVQIDKNLSWKPHVEHVCSKIKRTIGLLSKTRYFVNSAILLQLYYSLVYPYIIYGIVVWGHTYDSTLNPIFILQKKLVRIMTFSHYNAHTNQLFYNLKILKLPDITFLQTALFMFDYYSGNLPETFSNFFTQVHNLHHYNTRLASKLTYTLPRARTNYGKLNIKFSGVKCWNSIDDSIKNVKTKTLFREKLSGVLLSSYITY